MNYNPEYLKENAVAIHVYKKCGFEEDGTVPWNKEFLFMKKKFA